MAVTTANVVFVSPGADVYPLKKELVVKAATTILPGYLVTRASGEMDLFAGDGQGGDIFIADMNTLEQKAYTAALTAGDSYPAFVPQVGYEYNMYVADAQTVVVGSPLTSNGDGTLKVCATNGTETKLFTAEAAVTTSGSTGRIQVRFDPAGYSAII